MIERIKESIKYIKAKTNDLRPQIAIILGSGLGDLAEEFENKMKIKTSDIPNYPLPTVEGHAGNLVFGRLYDINLLGFQGRIHFYESGKIENVIYPVLVAHELGVKILIVTNAAGGLNKNFKPGDLMIIADHINFMFLNPLKIFSPNVNRFNKPAYDEKLRKIAIQTGIELGLPVREGIYCGVRGPNYETPSEVQMLRKIGSDAVGMSTVPEVITANYLGMRVLGISCITNYAAGISSTKLSHEEVTEVAQRVKNEFSLLIKETIKKIKQSEL
ncbi:purine-nucleoside phosphorylase [Candidatus Kryptobacter tengchongensis]|uniref:Purine nucleoside phosphorylase n=1 Tax=Kryptobacter tengchongensis TaxID=1643429 RepID=A0A656D858_KRYT1|nr:purine-nucleoside phosphorylase [Candidatus Kryptobacter tengchongensis]CUT00860.1 purine-nucleoside phosphorylase [Candidatus Kryptobacter tengchongensis]CUU09958.1 purine-nucleoside phosphorylase [Candidatus Kryptobacter tengchongensis]CUU10243.1 purine-nucleoside phosphorylase [Candidatus Kryptobacter tengchongensis]